MFESAAIRDTRETGMSESTWEVRGRDMFRKRSDGKEMVVVEERKAGLVETNRRQIFVVGVCLVCSIPST